jgi:HAE1 family hydrophobic/amphiphilic exporter-1
MAGLCLAATVMLFRGLPSELLPEVHQGEFTFEVALPVGTPLEITDEVLSPVADAILAEREHIEALIVTLGFDPTTSQRSDEGEHSARFKVILDSADPATEAARRRPAPSPFRGPAGHQRPRRATGALLLQDPHRGRGPR